MCALFVFWPNTYMVERQRVYSNVSATDTWTLFNFVRGLLSHQSQQAISYVLLWAAWQDVVFVQTALDTKSLTDASHCHEQSQKSRDCRCVHGLGLRRRSDGGDDQGRGRRKVVVQPTSKTWFLENRSMNSLGAASGLTSALVTSLLALIYTSLSLARNPKESWRKRQGGRTSP